MPTNKPVSFHFAPIPQPAPKAAPLPPPPTKHKTRRQHAHPACRQYLSAFGALKTAFENGTKQDIEEIEILWQKVQATRRDERINDEDVSAIKREFAKACGVYYERHKSKIRTDLALTARLRDLSDISGARNITRHCDNILAGKVHQL